MRLGIFLTVLFASAGGLRADVVEQGPKDAKPSGLLAGVARADITPPVGIPHLNWGSQTHVEAVGIDPPGMLATAMVISDGKQMFAMVDIDALSVGGIQDIIPRIASASGIAAAHIRLGATHTHAGPMFQREKGPLNVDPKPYEAMMASYKRLLAERITAAVVEAKGNLRPVHMYGGKGVGSIGANRRMRATASGPAAVGWNPDGYVDQEMVVFRVDDAAGKPVAVLVNYQCHGIVLTYENKLISPDWIGMMRKTVETNFPGALCLFFQGAAGNMGPIEWGTGDATVAHRLGTRLGLEASAVASKIETVKREHRFEGYVESTAFAAKNRWRVAGPRDATLQFVRTIVEVPSRRYPAAEMQAMEERVAAAEKALGPARASGDAWKKHQAEARWRRDHDLLAQYKKSANAPPVQVEIQILRIGDMAMVSVPGEPFAEIGAAIKRESPFPLTMFCGYSSGKGGDYIPVASEFPHGGYEVERTPYGTGAAESLIRQAVALFAKLQ
jgi:hypothetical protein